MLKESFWHCIKLEHTLVYPFHQKCLATSEHVLQMMPLKRTFIVSDPLRSRIVCCEFWCFSKLNFKETFCLDLRCCLEFGRIRRLLRCFIHSFIKSVLPGGGFILVDALQTPQVLVSLVAGLTFCIIYCVCWSPTTNTSRTND